MKVYNVNTTEYLDSLEFDQIVDHIAGIRQKRMEALAARYPDYKINPRTKVANFKEDKEMYNHLVSYNIPFYDSLICETLLHKDNEGFLELREFTYQLNNFSKTIFHRKKWADHNNNGHDSFLQFVWDDWKQYQFNNEFDLLTATADRLFESCENLLEFHQQFVYNDDYKFATEDEVREMFDEMVDKKIFLGKDGDLYKVYEGVEYEQATTDSKVKFHSGSLSKFDQVHLRGTFKIHQQLLSSMKSKLNFAPLDSTNPQFDGSWSEHKFGKKVFFIPQFLVFYHPVDKI